MGSIGETHELTNRSVPQAEHDLRDTDLVLSISKSYFHNIIA